MSKTIYINNIINDYDQNVGELKTADKNNIDDINKFGECYLSPTNNNIDEKNQVQLYS